MDATKTEREYIGSRLILSLLSNMGNPKKGSPAYQRKLQQSKVKRRTLRREAFAKQSRVRGLVAQARAEEKRLAKQAMEKKLQEWRDRYFSIRKECSLELASKDAKLKKIKGSLLVAQLKNRELREELQEEQRWTRKWRSWWRWVEREARPTVLTWLKYGPRPPPRAEPMIWSMQ